MSKPAAGSPARTPAGHEPAPARLPAGLAGPFWRRDGWVAFSADGTRIELPRTVDNEKAFGCAGRDKTGPQLQLTSLYHMGTGLPWAWRIGAGTESEQVHLRRMVGRHAPWGVTGGGCGLYEFRAAVRVGGPSCGGAGTDGFEPHAADGRGGRPRPSPGRTRCGCGPRTSKRSIPR